jgi:hypothetical protein
VPTRLSSFLTTGRTAALHGLQPRVQPLISRTSTHGNPRSVVRMCPQPFESGARGVSCYIRLAPRQAESRHQSGPQEHRYFTGITITRTPRTRMCLMTDHDITLAGVRLHFGHAFYKAPDALLSSTPLAPMCTDSLITFFTTALSRRRAAVDLNSHPATSSVFSLDDAQLRDGMRCGDRQDHQSS